MRFQGPGTNEFEQSYWSKALNWSQEQNSGKLMLNLHGTTVVEGKSISFGPKKSAKRRASDLENQESGYIGNQGRVPNSRIQFASNESKLVPRKLDPGTLVSKESGPKYKR